LLSGLFAALWWVTQLSGASDAGPPPVLEADSQLPIDEQLAGGPAPSTDREAVSSRGMSAATLAGLTEHVGCSGQVLRQLDHSPVAGAEVRIVRGASGGGALSISTQTDADGWFRFDGYLEGLELDSADLLVDDEDLYALCIEHPLGLASFEDRFMRSQLTGDPYGETAVDADLGVFLLAPSLSLSVRLVGEWESAGGLWLAEVAGSELPTLRLRQVGAWSDSLDPTWWDAFGAYTHRDVRRYMVAYDGRGLAWADLDLPLEGGPEHVLRFERAPPQRVELQLVDHADRPVKDVPVVATPTSGPLSALRALDRCYHRDLMRPAGFDRARRSKSNEQGVAVFDSLPVAAQVGLGANEQRIGSYVFCVGERGSETHPHRSIEHDLTARDGVIRLRMVYDPTATFDIAGFVLDVQRKPLAGIKVSAFDYPTTNSLTGNQGTPRETHDVTDSEGRFLLRDVDRYGQGVETISVDGSGIGCALHVFDVEVPKDGKLHSPILLLPAYELRGWLVGPEQRPVHRAGLSVGVRPAGIDPQRSLPAPDLRLPVAVDGSFSFELLPQGEYLLYPRDFEAHGLVPFDPFVFRAGEPLPEVVVESLDAFATRVELVVEDPLVGNAHSVARAVAIRERDGRLAPLVVEAVLGLGTNRITWEALPPGTWRIDVRLHGGRQAWRTLELDGGQPDLNEKLVLQSPGGLRASLESGAVTTALANAVVTARMIGPEWVDAGPDVESRFGAAGVQAEVGSDGRFRFDGLLPGRYELRVSGNGLVGRHRVQVESGKLTDCTMPVGPGRELILTGDADPFLRQGLRLQLYVRGGDGDFSAWPIRWEDGVARASLPEDAVEWEARWWSIGIPGRQPAVPLEGAARGHVDGAGGAPIQAKLPH
jgi:hypothetical protein